MMKFGRMLYFSKVEIKKIAAIKNDDSFLVLIFLKKMRSTGSAASRDPMNSVHAVAGI